MRARDIARQLGAELIDAPAPDGMAACVRCGRPRLPYADGRAALCTRCTCAELGVPPLTLALAVEFHLSIKATETRLEKYGPPHINPKAWITPRSRLHQH